VALLAPRVKPLHIDPNKTPYVILVVGVNGVGKTTTIGKLAKRLQGEGKKVMLAAGILSVRQRLSSFKFGVNVIILP
jgi:fused signal recognition particle receptor